MRQNKPDLSKIIKIIAAFCGTAVVLFSIAMCIYLQKGNETQTSISETQQEEQIDKIETQAVLAKENATRNFINREMPEYEDDDRSIFKIIEVIPHEACSIFPYLIEWGTEEEYDKNVPIGYEGMFWCATKADNVKMFSKDDVAAGEANPFTSKKGYLKKEYLSVYNNLVGDPNSGKWYRTSNYPNIWKNQDGYFEYVGAGNGLYYLSRHVTDVTNGEGIRHKYQPIASENNEDGAGDCYVLNSRFYWPKDKAHGVQTDTLARSYTGNNYDLCFSNSDIGYYRAKVSGRKSIVQGVANGNASLSYDYSLVAKDSTLSKYEFCKNGNYKATSCVAGAGDYIRIPDAKLADNCPGINIKGYFRLALNGESGDRYSVTFAKTSSGSGTYVINKNESDDDFYTQAGNYYFEYAGGNKGLYDVYFCYDDDNATTHYNVMENKIKVSDGNGRYALTSSRTSIVYSTTKSSSFRNDYTDGVTNISFINSMTQGYDCDWQKGVTLGGENGYYELGGWVFHPVTDPLEMKVTPIKRIRNGSSYNIGDKIYVKYQDRVCRYYTRDSYINNEWFKLLCYSNNPNDSEQPYSAIVDGVGYQMNQTAEWNLAQTTAKELIKAFDNKFRIEVVQKTPEDLTPKDVEEADLLYFSTRQGIEGLADNWGEMNKYLISVGKEALPSLPPQTDGCNPSNGQFVYTSDISNDTLFAIYRCCIDENTTALMVNRMIRNHYSYANGAKENLMKMYFFMDYFQNAREWSYFMDAYEHDEHEEYSLIHTYNGEVGAYKAEGYNHYNMRAPDEGWDNYGDYSDSWDPMFFEVYYPGTDILRLSGSNDFTNDSKSSMNKVQDGETKLLFEEYGAFLFKDPANMHNIWKILNNRQGGGDIVVEITNADIVNDTNRTHVIYANEFDPKSFDVKFKVFLLGGKGTPVALQNATISVVDGGGDVLLETIGGIVYGSTDDYTSNVRSSFILTGTGLPVTDAPLNPSITSHLIRVTATDVNGKTGQAEVKVIVREAFNLN